MITQATYDLSVSYLKSQLDKIRQSENLNYLWSIALELNSNKVLSNAKLQIISNHLYNLKQRRNSKRLATVKEMLISSIQTMKAQGKSRGTPALPAKITKMEGIAMKVGGKKNKKRL